MTRKTGVIVSIIGSTCLLVAIFVYAWYTLQLIPAVMIPATLVLIPLLCSIALWGVHSKTLAYVALVYPIILLFGTGVYITACTLVMGLNSIPLVIFLLFLCSLVTFVGIVLVLTSSALIKR